MYHLRGEGRGEVGRLGTYESLEHLAQLVDGNAREGHELDGIYILCIILGDVVGMAVVPLYSYDVTAAAAAAATTAVGVSSIHFTIQ